MPFRVNLFGINVSRISDKTDKSLLTYSNLRSESYFYWDTVYIASTTTRSGKVTPSTTDDSHCTDITLTTLKKCLKYFTHAIRMCFHDWHTSDSCICRFQFPAWVTFTDTWHHHTSTSGNICWTWNDWQPSWLWKRLSSRLPHYTIPSRLLITMTGKSLHTHGVQPSYSTARLSRLVASLIT